MTDERKPDQCVSVIYRTRRVVSEDDPNATTMHDTERESEIIRAIVSTVETTWGKRAWKNSRLIVSRSFSDLRIDDAVGYEVASIRVAVWDNRLANLETLSDEVTVVARRYAADIASEYARLTAANAPREQHTGGNERFRL